MTALRHLEVHRIDQAQIEIRWEMKGQTGLVSIYEGSTPDRIDTDVPVAQVPCESVVLRRPEEEGRRYYKVVPQAGSGKIVAERLVPFEQIRNFRDLGGYETSNGRSVKWGTVYRSGELSQTTEADLTHLSNLGIRVVFDVRSPEVVRERPDRLLGSGARLAGQAMDDVETSRWVATVLAGHVSDAQATREMMVQSYASSVHMFVAETAVILRMLSDPGNLPAVFHCQAGKDRTGRVAALLLMLLGVPLTTVLEDYLLSNRYRAALIERRAATHLYPDAVRALEMAREENLLALLESIHSLYGSVEQYAVDALGLTSSTIDGLQSLLLST